MHRYLLASLCFMIAGCVYSPTTILVFGTDRSSPATRPAEPAARVRLVAPWKPNNPPDDQVNLIAMGDWGANTARQKEVAATLARYVSTRSADFNAVLTAGDNFYMTLKDADDLKFKTVFEDMYDASRLNLPFYATFGNHDYDGDRETIEQAYADQHPDSRFKHPAKWYRLEFPAGRPIVTVLMLDSNRWDLGSDEWDQQLKWIEEELSRPRQSKWTLCVAHHPIYSNGDHGDSYTLDSDWAELVKKHKVDFYLCGHDHSLQHLQLEDHPTTFVITGGGGAARRDMRRDDRGPFSRKLYGFAHLRFTDSSAEVTCVDGVNGKIVHQFTRNGAGQIAIVQTTPSDKPVTSFASRVASVPGTVLATGSASTPNSPARRALAAKGDDHEQMQSVLSFTTEQKAKFKQKLAEHNAAYDKWTKTADGKQYTTTWDDYRAAKQANDEQKLTELQPEYDRLQPKQEEVRLKLRREFNSALTLTQQQRWGGHILFTTLIGRFDKAGLSAEQKQQAFAACVALAALAVDEKELERNPYLAPSQDLQTRAASIIHEHVLTTAQRKKQGGGGTTRPAELNLPTASDHTPPTI